MFNIFHKSEPTPERVHMNAIQTEQAMNDLLASLNKQADPNITAVKNLLISYMYTTCILEDTIFKIFEDFCTTGILPAMNTIPGFNDHSRITEYTGGLVR